MTIEMDRPSGREPRQLEAGAPKEMLALPSGPGKYRKFMDNQRLPQPSRALPVAKRVVVEDAAKWAWMGVKLPALVLSEMRPICLGIGKMANAWYSWINCDKDEERFRLLESPSSKHSEQITKKRSANRKISLAVALMMLAGGTVAAFMQPAVLGVAGFAFLAIADLMGRKDRPVEAKVPEPHRMVLTEGVSFSAITKELFSEIAPRENLEMGLAEPMRYDPVRKQFEMKVTCLDEIEDKHLRAFERGLGAKPFTIRAPHDEGDPATVRRLTLRVGDPLGEVPKAPFIPTGSLSISQPLDLGISLSDVPFAVNFAGQHFKIVAKTGGGKTRWAAYNIIDRVSACHNSSLLSIDLSGKADLDMWQGVIQKRAHDPNEAKDLLEEVADEMVRRGKVLRRFAEDDDPRNDHLTEWCDELAEMEGPAWVIPIDEFHLLSADPELLKLAEFVIRVGRGLWVSLVTMTQKTGNNDFGSTVMQSQAQNVIALACDPDDTNRLFSKQLRDAGWLPHLLVPGTDKGVRNDAGKAYVRTPRLTTPDVYSFYAPLDGGEVKALARQRLADGICPMYIGDRATERDIEDGIVIPPVWAEMEGLFARHGEKLPTETILTHLRMIDPKVYGKWTGNDLANAVAPHLRPKRNLNIAPGNNPKGYLRSEFEAALQTLTREG